MVLEDLFCSFISYPATTRPPHFYPSIFVFTHPNDGWTGLYTKLCPQDAVQALCLPPTTLNLLMNAFVHPYLVFYVIFNSRIIFFLLITYILIFIIRAVCIHTGGRYYTHDICIVFCNHIFYINFYNLFN